MKSYILIFALLSAVAAAYFALLTRRIDHSRNLYAARAALYASIREGNVSQSSQEMEILASKNSYELWSTCVRTGRKADVERLLMQLREEEDKLALHRRKKNWAKPVSILLAVVAAVAILFSVSDAVALGFPNSWWAQNCRAYYACIPGSHGSRQPGRHSRKAAVAIPARQAPRAVIPVAHAMTRLPAKRPEHRQDSVAAPTREPVATNTASPQTTTPGCGTLAGEVPCVVRKVTKVAGQCALGPLENLVNVGTLSVNLPDVASTTQCITTDLLGSSATSAVSSGSSVSPSAPASTKPDSVAPSSSSPQP